MDWDSMYLMAREYLQMGDEEFWTCSFKKYNALIDKALKMKGIITPEVDQQSNEAIIDRFL